MRPTHLTQHAENVWLSTVNLLPGFTVEVVPSIASTNSELMRRAREGSLDPVLLAAEEQTAGRGRMGKGWHSSRAGQSLTFSLALPLSPVSWSGLSLVVGLSLAEQLHTDLRLKWPNDLWLYQRKLGGILVETASVGQGAEGRRLVVIGIGINISRPEVSQLGAVPEAAPGGMPAMPPAGLAEVCMGQTAGETLEAVVPALVRDVLRFESEGFGAFAARFAERDTLFQQAVRLSDGRQGLAQGVDASGALLVNIDGLVQAITSSEVSVRPC
ncbi:biotin--[acetyl-CoA-carboxylase] ligase [Hydrogenophaga sp. PAMC20947]|uniref:biotin--[acetyl-CoA-carboxylase] ligase n=1 Tax=Hydrogenophaga sp. PAMC20947 TaxID=2565558 RepID=UPI00109E11AB|nr:biotin--[acetyl-CoA-carboxylase] ligase [Hydrogenophaga sp. PAMC20947]QCB47741.1 biotin--[acetyl-CoA-carboxylase] ligase [Hydrogenophaga sp. PAMC20947]